MCRLHQRDECKFGVKCSNLHLCRPFWGAGAAAADAADAADAAADAADAASRQQQADIVRQCIACPTLEAV